MRTPEPVLFLTLLALACSGSDPAGKGDDSGQADTGDT